jgi:hypothetical protein
MTIGVTSLVHNIILPCTEPDDIIGLENIQGVNHWMIAPESDPHYLSVGLSTGGILTIILCEGNVFVGTATIPRGDIDVKGITERIRAYTDFTEVPC